MGCVDVLFWAILFTGNRSTFFGDSVCCCAGVITWQLFIFFWFSKKHFEQQSSVAPLPCWLLQVTSNKEDGSEVTLQKSSWTLNHHNNEYGTPNDEAVQSTPDKSVVQGLNFVQIFHRSPSIAGMLHENVSLSSCHDNTKPTLHEKKPRDKNLAIHSAQCPDDQHRAAAKPPNNKVRRPSNSWCVNTQHGINQDNYHGCICCCLLWWERYLRMATWSSHSDSTKPYDTTTMVSNRTIHMRKVSYLQRIRIPSCIDEVP